MSTADSLALRFWSNQRLPVLLQTEASECGIVCIAMIASYWGHQIDMANMRRRFSVSLKGATLKGLMDVAQTLGLHVRPLKLDVKVIPDLKLPCILHWDMTHFVVLKKVSRGGIVVHEGVSGFLCARRLMSL